MANNKYTVMELEAIKKLCKCVNSVASLPADLIADTNVATNTTYSSYKIDAEMIALENDIQRYVDTALAGLNKLTKEVIDDKALVVKENVLYLYKDPTDMNNDYMQMMLINGVAVELGSTTCDFSSVYSKDEANDKFALKIDLDVLTTSFNNFATAIDEKVDKTDIVDNLTSTDTDKPLSANQGMILNDTINEMKTNFQDGVNTIYDSVVAKGVTPVDKSPSSIVEALDKAFNNLTLIKEYSSDGLKIYSNRGIIEEGGYYKDEKYKICYVNVICRAKIDISATGSSMFLFISGLPMPLIRNNYKNPTFLSIENIDNPNSQDKAGYGIDGDGINGCIFVSQISNNERVRIHGAYQYSES